MKFGNVGTYTNGEAVVEGGVTAPTEALIRWEFPRALAFEEEDAFAEGVGVVVGGGADGGEREEENNEGSESPACRHWMGGGREWRK